MFVEIEKWNKFMNKQIALHIYMWWLSPVAIEMGKIKAPVKIFWVEWVTHPTLLIYGPLVILGYAGKSSNFKTF